MSTDLVCEIELTPAFHDLDPMEVVWHGHYLKYLELARCALLQRYDYDYPQMRASGYAWPIVDLRSKYVRSAATDRCECARKSWSGSIASDDYYVGDVATARCTRAHTCRWRSTWRPRDVLRVAAGWRPAGRVRDITLCCS